MDNTKVTIVGGGNIGMCLAGEISRVRGYDVTIYASHPEQFSRRIQVADDEKRVVLTSGDITATYDPDEAFPKADVILCTLPSQLQGELIDRVGGLVRPGALWGFCPGYGGGELYCEPMLTHKVTIFALQKVPYVARTKERGKVAGLWSKKKRILAAALPHEATQRVCSLLEDMLWMECAPLKNYMAATLLPGNPLLHTSGSYVYLKGYKQGRVFPEQIYYYRAWDDECSRVICSFSDEMMEICDKLPLDLSDVQSIQEYYESPTPEALTRKFHSIPSFHDLTLPMKPVEGGFVPDFSSRFYTQDIPDGVCVLKGLALMVGVETPTIDTILDWYRRMTGKEYFLSNGEFGKDIAETAVPQVHGLKTPDDLKRFYLR